MFCGQRVRWSVVLLGLCVLPGLADVAAGPPEVVEPPTYVLGAPLSAPEMIQVDRYGRIYVLDTDREMVMRFGITGELEASWPTEEHDAQFRAGRTNFAVSPEGIIFLGQAVWDRTILRIGPDGRRKFKSAEEYQERVVVARDDGSYMTSLPIFSYEGERTTGLEAVRYVDYDSEGRVLWVKTLKPEVAGTVGPDGLLYRLDSKAQTLEVWDFSGKLKRQVKLHPEFKAALGGNLQIDRNGDIYVGNYDYIARFSSSGKQLACMFRGIYQGRSLPGSGCFGVANGMVFRITNQEAYSNSSEVSNGAHRDYTDRLTWIDLFAPDGRCVARYAPSKPELNMPGSMAVGEDGSYMVVENGTSAVWLYTAKGRKQISMRAGYHPEPINVAAKPGGGYYVVTEEFDASGAFVKDLYTRDPSIDERHGVMPGHIAVDPVSKNLWSLGGWGVLECFSEEGKAVKRFGERMDLCFRSFSIGMAVDSDGFIYLPDTWKHRIVKVDSEGQIVTTWGKEGSGIGEMRYPEGLVLDGQGRLYVVDSENNRIQVFDTSGKPLGVWGRPGELNRPFGIAIGPGNVLWITDTFNDRIVKVSLAEFWKQVRTEVAPEPTPAAGSDDGLVWENAGRSGVAEATLTGVVVAGSDDFTDVIYVESQDRAWGARVTLPKGKAVKRGTKLKVTGVPQIKERAAKHVAARVVEELLETVEEPGPLGMSNLYVGDGYRSGDRKIDLSNQGLLVRTWGTVVSVDEVAKLFVINDGSYPGGKGVAVYAGNLARPLSTWPRKGQYLCVTGLSVSVTQGDGEPVPGVRVRGQEDIRVMKE